jgi:hypothetical protein
MKNIKSVFTWIIKNILWVAFALLLLVILILWLQNKSLKKESQIKDVLIASQNDTVKSYKTKAGEAYFKWQSIEVERNALKGSLEVMGIDMKKLKAENIKWRDLVSVQNIKIEAMGQIIANTHDSIIPSPPDTISNHASQIPQVAQVFDWTSPGKNLTLNGYFLNKVLNAKYTYQIGLQLSTEKHGKDYIVTASLTDPNAKISTASQITIIPTKHWWEKPWIWGLVGLAGGIYITK